MVPPFETLSLFRLPMKPLSERQQEVLAYVQQFIHSQGFPPTVRDIQLHFGLASPAGVHKHLRLLKERGYIERNQNQSRSIRIVTGEGDPAEAMPRAEPQVVELPLMGYVAAGQPIEAIAQGQDALAVPVSLLGGAKGSHKKLSVATLRHYFVLQVRGDSMIDDSVLDGDFVILEPRDSAQNGEMVVALVNGEATLKRLYHEPGKGDEAEQIRLQPANPTMQPIYALAEEVRVQGVVVGIWRSC